MVVACAVAGAGFFLVLPALNNHNSISLTSEVDPDSADRRDRQENCRLLGIVDRVPPDTDAIATILKSFAFPSYPQDSGWSLSAYSNYETGGLLGVPGEPMIIRSQVPIIQDRNTWNAVTNLVTRLEPELIIGHLRNASSGCSFIADPHPFKADYDGRTYLFCHNGGVWDKDLEIIRTQLIKGDTEPQNCPGSPIDSEILFIYLMELIEFHNGDVWRAVYDWSVTLTSKLYRDWNALNILLTDGEIIWAVRISYKSDRFFLRYQSLPDKEGWAISTQDLGPGWTHLPNYSVSEFRAGHLVYTETIPFPIITEVDENFPVMNPEPIKFFKPEQ